MHFSAKNSPISGLTYEKTGGKVGAMKSKPFKKGDRVWYYGCPGRLIDLPTDDFGEFKIWIRELYSDKPRIVYCADYEITHRVKARKPARG